MCSSNDCTDACSGSGVEIGDVLMMCIELNLDLSLVVRRQLGECGIQSISNSAIDHRVRDDGVTCWSLRVIPEVCHSSVCVLPPP